MIHFFLPKLCCLALHWPYAQENIPYFIPTIQVINKSSSEHWLKLVPSLNSRENRVTVSMTGATSCVIKQMMMQHWQSCVHIQFCSIFASFHFSCLWASLRQSFGLFLDSSGALPTCLVCFRPQDTFTSRWRRLEKTLSESVLRPWRRAPPHSSGARLFSVFSLYPSIISSKHHFPH